MKNTFYCKNRTFEWKTHCIAETGHLNEKPIALQKQYTWIKNRLHCRNMKFEWRTHCIAETGHFNEKHILLQKQDIWMKNALNCRNGTFEWKTHCFCNVMCVWFICSISAVKCVFHSNVLFRPCNVFFHSNTLLPQCNVFFFQMSCFYHAMCFSLKCPVSAM